MYAEDEYSHLSFRMARLCPYESQCIWRLFSLIGECWNRRRFQLLSHMLINISYHVETLQPDTVQAGDVLCGIISCLRSKSGRRRVPCDRRRHHSGSFKSSSVDHTEVASVSWREYTIKQSLYCEESATPVLASADGVIRAQCLK